MRYEVGDYVRIKDNLDGEGFEYVTDDMKKFCGKLGRIIKIKNTKLDDNDEEVNYFLSFDKDNIWIEDYMWGINAFEYRLGNYEDNELNNTLYKIKYKLDKYASKSYIFKGHIDNFAPCDKSAFINDKGVMLVLPWNLIEYVVPIGDET